MKNKNVLNPDSPMGIKFESLIKSLKKLGSVIVAFSAGVDSTFLLSSAVLALGPEKVVAVTADSSTYQRHLFSLAKEFAASLGVRHILVETNEMNDIRFLENSSRRCYYCKSELFNKISQAALENSIKHILEGSNLDDTDDYRPGFEAVLEYGVKSPLKDNGLSKSDVRELSRLMALPTWNMPQSACLSSRIPFGTPIDHEKLIKIESAEDILRNIGFELFRVRYHGDIARIEVEERDFVKFLDTDTKQYVFTKIKKIGFKYVVLDLAGYRLSGPENLKNFT